MRDDADDNFSRRLIGKIQNSIFSDAHAPTVAILKLLAARRNGSVSSARIDRATRFCAAAGNRANSFSHLARARRASSHADPEALQHLPRGFARLVPSGLECEGIGQILREISIGQQLFQDCFSLPALQGSEGGDENFCRCFSYAHPVDSRRDAVHLNRKLISTTGPISAKLAPNCVAAAMPRSAFRLSPFHFLPAFPASFPRTNNGELRTAGGAPPVSWSHITCHFLLIAFLNKERITGGFRLQ